MNTEKYKIKLEEEKSRIEESLLEVGRKDKTGDWEAVPEIEVFKQEVPDEADLAERSEDYKERSVKVDDLEKRLLIIQKALQNIEDNRYGVCDICEKQIEEDRLEANPAALTCKECMNKV